MAKTEACIDQKPVLKVTKSAYISYYENHDIKSLIFKSFAQIITCKYQGFVKHFITDQGIFKHHMQCFILSRKPL